MAIRTKRHRSTPQTRKVLTSFLIDATMLAALKQTAARQERSLGQVLRLAARQYLDAHAHAGRKGGGHR